MAEFGEYSLLRNNCQKFLRNLSDKILINVKAADYPWFMSNTKTKYQKDQWLLPPPAEMMLRNLDRMRQQQMQNMNMQNMVSSRERRAIPTALNHPDFVLIATSKCSSCNRCRCSKCSKHCNYNSRRRCKCRCSSRRCRTWDLLVAGCNTECYVRDDFHLTARVEHIIFKCDQSITRVPIST